jgi:hypothetical protein
MLLYKESTDVDYAKGTRICKQDDKGFEMYFLVSGMCDVIVDGQKVSSIIEGSAGVHTTTDSCLPNMLDPPFNISVGSYTQGLHDDPRQRVRRTFLAAPGAEDGHCISRHYCRCC